MPSSPSLELDHTHSSWLLLGTLAGAGLLAWGLYQIGLLGAVLGVVMAAIRGAIRWGFLLWERLFSWASWPVFLALVLAQLIFGGIAIAIAPFLSILCALALLVSGVATCLAYMFIDLERYEVQRGYKAVHNPLKGQEPALFLARYGAQVRLPLLIAASIGLVGGFALLNQGLQETIGRDWYGLSEKNTEPVYVDFLTYALIHLYGIVDVLNLAKSRHLLDTSYVKPAAWPAAVLLSAFKAFFTVVLLQQIFASVRQGKLLAETIADFWSPHLPIHERARNALPEYGPIVIGPLLLSLRNVGSLTKEQREQLPRVLATIGPATIPTLIQHLDAPDESVRGVAATALAHLGALDTVALLAPLVHDSSEAVRLCLVGALGELAAHGASLGQKKHARFKFRHHHQGFIRWTFWKKKPTPVAMSQDPIELTVVALASALSDDSTTVRGLAAQALGRAGSCAAAVTGPLIALLSDQDEAVRCRAAEALGQVGGEDEATVPALIKLLQEASAEVKVAAAKALGALKKKAEPAVGALTPLLLDREESVRTAAAEAIACVGPINGADTQALAEGLASDDNLVRARTAEALGTIGAGAQEAAPALVEAMKDENDRVRAKAVEALGKMGESAGQIAAPSLGRALRDADSWVSALAAEALGQMGESADVAIPALVRSLKHPNPLVRGNAAEALGKMGPAARRTQASLEEAARDEEGGVRSRAIRALGEVGQPTDTARKVVYDGLRDADPLVQAAAVETVGDWEETDEAIVNVLLALLQDANDQVKIEVAGVLPKLTGPTTAVIEGLCRLLEEEDSAEVQIQAALALGKFGAEAQAAGGALLRVAQTSEANVREQAMRSIAIIQPPETVQAFTVGLKDASGEIRKVASGGWMNALSIPEEVIPALVEALRDPEIQVRTNSAHALARLESLPGEAVPLLIECTNQGSDSLRLNAAMALRLAPGEETSEVMQHLLDDPNLRVRLVAAGTLLAAKVDDPRARKVVEEGLQDSSGPVRKAALELVESLGADGAMFAEMLEKRRTEEEEPRVREVLDRLTERLAASAAEAAAGES